MFKNYLKTAFRNFIRHKGYTSINIFGLAIGMAGCVLILFYVQHELSFNNFHKNGARIYRLIAERKAPTGTSIDAVTPPPLAFALTNDFPEVTNFVRFLNTDNPLPLISSGTKRFYEKQVFFVDAGIFDVFTIPFIVGNAQNALKEPSSVVITENTASKYFGTDNPIGKTLRLNNHLNLQVTGVIKNFPSNSTINTDFLVSFSTLYSWVGKDFVENWNNYMCQTYVLLDKNSQADLLAKRLPGFINKHVDKSNPLKNIYLQPLSRIHLYSREDYNLNAEGDIRYIYLLTAIALFILLVACFNYVSLTTTQLILRSKEIGIRKLLGSTNKQIILKFLGEGLFFTTLALVIALIIVVLVLPGVQNIIGRNFSIDYLKYWKMIAIPAALVLLIGSLAGSFPVFHISFLQPVNAIKAHMRTGAGKVTFRKILVVIQFSLTNLLIIGSLVIYNQLAFMQNKDLGFDASQVIVVPIRDEGLRQNQDAVKEKLLQFAGVQQVGAAALLPGGPVGKTRFHIKGISETGTISMLWVDYDFVKTLGIKLIAGRGFSKNFTTDASEGFIINEEAVKRLGFKNSADAVGKSFELPGSKKGSIIGVVNNFHLTSLQSKIEPVVLHIWPWLNYLLIRTDVKHVSTVIDNLKNIWNEFEPAYPFEFNFLNDNFARFYAKENQLEKISTGFTFIALLIACLGLFSLSAFLTERRTKEIGIRKVLGASIAGILGTQLKELLILVLIAIIIAFPVGFYVMTNWLQNYAYHVGIDISTIFLTGLISLTTAILTVSYHAVKAAVTNPVEALRYE